MCFAHCSDAVVALTALITVTLALNTLHARWRYTPCRHTGMKHDALTTKLNIHHLPKLVHQLHIMIPALLSVYARASGRHNGSQTSILRRACPHSMLRSLVCRSVFSMALRAAPISDWSGRRRLSSHNLRACIRIDWPKLASAHWRSAIRCLIYKSMLCLQ